MSIHVQGFQSFFRFFASFCTAQIKHQSSIKVKQVFVREAQYLTTHQVCALFQGVFVCEDSGVPVSPLHPSEPKLHIF